MYPNGFNVDPSETRPVQRNSAIRSSFKQTIDVNNPQPIANRLRPLQNPTITTAQDFCPFETSVEPPTDEFTNVIPLVQWSERKLAGYIDHFGERPVGAHQELFEQAWNIYLSNQHNNAFEEFEEDEANATEPEPVIDVQALLHERGNLVRRMMEIDMIVNKARQAEQRNTKA